MSWKTIGCWAKAQWSTPNVLNDSLVHSLRSQIWEEASWTGCSFGQAYFVSGTKHVYWNIHLNQWFIQEGSGITLIQLRDRSAFTLHEDGLACPFMHLLHSKTLSTVQRAFIIKLGGACHCRLIHLHFVCEHDIHPSYYFLYILSRYMRSLEWMWSVLKSASLCG